MEITLPIDAGRRSVTADVSRRLVPLYRRGFLVFLLSLMFPAAAQERSPNVQEIARRIVAQTNEFRRKELRQEVRSNDKLTKASLEFAGFLSRSDKFGHSADGRRPEERATQHGYDYCIVTENLSYQYSSEGFRAEELARKILQGWERSPGHRKNLLNPEVTEIGVAVARNEQSGYYYAVQMFGRHQSQASEFKITNNSGIAIPYVLSGESLSLPPGSTRTHRQCGSIEFEIRWPDGQSPTTVSPSHGDRYTIARGSSGKLRLTK